MDKSKVKLTIHPRLEGGKESPRFMSIEDAIESAGADWDPADPGVGKAALLPDGREIFNPVPFAPPVGYREEPSIMEQVQRMLRAERQSALDDEAVESAEESNDFPDDEEPAFYSFYQLQLMEDYPNLPDLPAPGEVPPAEPPAAPGGDSPPAPAPKA